MTSYSTGSEKILQGEGMFFNHRIGLSIRWSSQCMRALMSGADPSPSRTQTQSFPRESSITVPRFISRGDRR